VVVAHPFDLVKVRMQTGDGKLGASGLEVVSNTVRKEGFGALFRGIAFPLIGYMPINVVVFGVYGGVKRNLRPLENDENDKNGLVAASAFDDFVAGCAAGVIQTPLCAPVETLKIRMQSQLTGGNAILMPGSKAFSNSAEALRNIVKNEGFNGVYRGVGATILRDGVGYGMYFGLFSKIQQILTPPGNTKPGHVATFAAGGFSGMICYAACYPLDTIKTRVQSQSNRNIVDAARSVWRARGISGFYNGIGPTLLRAFPENAAILYTYEMVIRLLDK